ncbi:MAG: tetratricopeptide repeat protein [Deltaproteobacteria bacterium]|nr:tetratricopeptide repeat protein [Deltaproteobacteria bacterium]
MAKHKDYVTQSDEHNARGIELADRGWLDEAMSEFRKAIKLDPLSAHAHDNLATILAEKGQLIDALSEYLEALKADPESPSAYHYLGSFLAAHGHELAISQYRKAIELEYEFPDAHLNLALALADNCQLDAAISELEIALEQAPEDEMISHELASCLIDLGRHTEAIHHLKRIIKTHPQHIEIWIDLGIAYTAQGFFAEAESAFKKGINIDNQNFGSHYHIAALYTSWNRHRDALDFLETAKTIDSERTRKWLLEDRVFDPLRDEPRFKKLIANE